MAFTWLPQVRGETLHRSPKSIPFALFALSFLGAHAICLMLFRSRATLVTYPFLILAPSFALAGACWRARAAERQSRTPWLLLGAGLFLWTCGIGLSAWEDLFQQMPGDIAWFSDFCFFLYGVPILLAISSVSNKQRIPLFVWMDGIQAVLTAYLAYITIFTVVPFSGTGLEPVSASVLVLTYNVENILLAVAATLRLLLQPREKDRGFYALLCGYLWIYAIVAGVYNNWAASSDGHAVIDVIVDVPFLLLGAACMMRAQQKGEADVDDEKRPLDVVIENGSPIFYTLALLALSIPLIREHFYVGTIGIVTALIVHTIRTTVLQSRLVRTQQALRDARDRLEKIALTDALTHAANRRCFDQTLALEWNRAARNALPLGLLLIDIDHFKKLNDRYGHPAGDRCLVAVASALQTALPRSGDLLARYGGEEFAAILPATDEDGARRVAAKMLAAVSSMQIRNETSLGDFVTVSIGIAVFGSAGTGSVHQIVEAADRALYRAKEHGRNRIESIGQRDFLGTGSV
ncbi:GGDEF domain-containing protein [Paraburkholderia caffeinilytica]|uniref:GGDEF domain-containing protein n=1 Tax=Paraburkholderia caffeinilytica TaxID=1761016 RepID=UPI0038BBBE48